MDIQVGELGSGDVVVANGGSRGLPRQRRQPQQSMKAAAAKEPVPSPTK